MMAAKPTETTMVPAIAKANRRHGAAATSVALSRRIVSCSMGMNTVVNARNWIVQRTVIGANSVGPRLRPTTSWKRYAATAAMRVPTTM